MGKEIFEDEKMGPLNVNFTAKQRKYLRSLGNYSKFMRWLLDNYAEYQKFLKEQDVTD